MTIPGGQRASRPRTEARPAAGSTFSFTVADGSVLRLQELLAQLELPPGVLHAQRHRRTSGTGRGPADVGDLRLALADARRAHVAVVPGRETVITKAAVEMFQNQNGLTVDGLAGPKVWSTLLADVAAKKVDSAPYTYVLVTKVLPESLTLYNNGVAQYTGIPVNTGAPGADTADGTFPVFEHVRPRK